MVLNTFADYFPPWYVYSVFSKFVTLTDGRNKIFSMAHFHVTYVLGILLCLAGEQEVSSLVTQHTTKQLVSGHGSR